MQPIKVRNKVTVPDYICLLTLRLKVLMLSCTTWKPFIVKFETVIKFNFEQKPECVRPAGGSRVTIKGRKKNNTHTSEKR